MDEAKIISDVCRARRGIRPAFTPSHVFLALKELLKGPIGRATLSKRLGLGEASTRTLISRLRELGLVEVDKVAGVILTNKGINLISKLISIVKTLGSINTSSICESTYSEAAIIRGGAKYVEKIGILDVRDLLVKYGAKGGIILYYRDKRFFMPTPSGLELFTDRSIVDQLLSRAEVLDGDAIIIALCSSSKGCLNSLINAIIAMLGIAN